MNPQTIKFARRARLSYQSQLLFARDEHGYHISDEDGPVLDLDRAPVVLQDVGVPPPLTGATFASSKFKLVDEVRDWYVDVLNRATDEYFAVLVGDSASYTAAAVLRNAVKHGYTIAWYDWHDFTRRYTDSIERSDVLSSSSPEEVAEAAHETYEVQEEGFRLRHVYDVLAIVDFNITDVRDFAVADITSMVRNRSNFGLTTIITVPLANVAPLAERNTKPFGLRAALLHQFEDEGSIFDGRPNEGQ